MRVIIIGGGLGGLCLAQGLQENNIDVAVFERETSLTYRGQGYRLHINAVGQTALRACLPDNVWRAFVATCARPTPTFSVVNEKLSLKFSVDIAKSEKHTNDTSGSELIADRLTMRTILSAGLSDVIHFGKSFAGFETSGDRVVAHFDDGSQEIGDILIGADGINSVVRAQHLPQARVYDTQLRSIFAKVPLDDELEAAVPAFLFDNLFSVAIGPTPPLVRRLGRIPELILLGIGGAPKYHCAIGPFRFREPPEQIVAELTPDVHLPDTRDYTMCTFGSRQEDMPVDDETAMSMSGSELEKMCLEMVENAGYDPAVRALIERWDLDTVTYQVIRSAVPAPTWEPSNVTVMGDAIHAMSPTGGNGANTAYRDAANILRALTAARDGASLESEIGSYERKMRKYGAAGIKESVSRGKRLVGQLPVPRR